MHVCSGVATDRAAGASQLERLCGHRQPTAPAAPRAPRSMRGAVGAAIIKAERHHDPAAMTASAQGRRHAFNRQRDRSACHGPTLYTGPPRGQLWPGDAPPAHDNPSTISHNKINIINYIQSYGVRRRNPVYRHRSTGTCCPARCRDFVFGMQMIRAHRRCGPAGCGQASHAVPRGVQASRAAPLRLRRSVRAETSISGRGDDEGRKPRADIIRN